MNKTYKIILLIMFFSGIILLQACNMFKTKIYRSEVKVELNPSDKNYNLNDEFIYAGNFLKSDTCNIQIINTLGLVDSNATQAHINMIIGKLKNRLIYKHQINTNYFVIELKSAEPVKATTLINCAADIYKTEIEKDKTKKSKLNVNIIYGKPPIKPIYP